MSSKKKISNFIESIQQANKWREVDFAHLKQKPSSISEKIWIRMCIPIVYAHWEGYIKSIFIELVKFIETQNLDSKKVHTHILALTEHKIYPSSSNKKEFQQIVDVINNIQEIQSLPIKINKKHINTESNLHFEVFKDLCHKFLISLPDGLQNNIFKKEINSLVHQRNEVAHGENPPLPDLESIHKLIQLVQESFADFLIAISDYLEKREYLKNKKKKWNITL